jgi:hypothetical protein
MNEPLVVETLDRKGAGPYDDLHRDAKTPIAQLSVAWSDVIAPLGPDAPSFLVARDPGRNEVVGGLPLYCFRGPSGAVLTSVPQAGPLGGAIVRRGVPDEREPAIYAALLRAALDLGRAQGCVSLTIITNPFSGDERLYRDAAPPDLVLNNFCQVIDLGAALRSGERVFADNSRHNNHVRKNLAKSREAGVQVDWARPGDLDAWYAIHRKRHGELGAQPLPEPLLRAILAVLGEAGTAGLAIARVSDRIIGGCIFIWSGSVADAFIMSADSDYLQTGVNYAITEFALKRFREKGVRWFNWQSCRRGTGVYTFKERWGSVEKPYAFLTWTLPGFDAILEKTTPEISAHFPWHYVAPFAAIEAKVNRGTFEKP